MARPFLLLSLLLATPALADGAQNFCLEKGGRRALYERVTTHGCPDCNLSLYALDFTTLERKPVWSCSLEDVTPPPSLLRGCTPMRPVTPQALGLQLRVKPSGPPEYPVTPPKEPYRYVARLRPTLEVLHEEAVVASVPLEVCAGQETLSLTVALAATPGAPPVLIADHVDGCADSIRYDPAIVVLPAALPPKTPVRTRLGEGLVWMSSPLQEVERPAALERASTELEKSDPTLAKGYREYAAALRSQAERSARLCVKGRGATLEAAMPVYDACGRWTVAELSSGRPRACEADALSHCVGYPSNRLSAVGLSATVERAGPLVAQPVEGKPNALKTLCPQRLTVRRGERVLGAVTFEPSCQVTGERAMARLRAYVVEKEPGVLLSVEYPDPLGNSRSTVSLFHFPKVEDVSNAPLNGSSSLVPLDLPPRRAVALNDEGMNFYRAKAYPSAIAAFGAAVGLAAQMGDSYGLARFNLAATLARTGQKDAAVGELSMLLSNPKDKARFTPRVRKDPDFDGIREDPSFLALFPAASGDAGR